MRRIWLVGAALCLLSCSGLEASRSSSPFQLLYESSFELNAAKGRTDERSWSVRDFSGVAMVEARVVASHGQLRRPAQASVTLGAGSDRAGIYFEVAERPRRNYGLVIREPHLIGAVAVEQSVNLSLHWDRFESAWIQVGDDPVWHRLPVSFTPETLRVSCASADVVVDRVAFYAVTGRLPIP